MVEDRRVFFKLLKWRHSSFLIVFLMSGSTWWSKCPILAQELSPISLVVLWCCVWMFIAVSQCELLYLFVLGGAGGVYMGLAHSVRMGGRVSNWICFICYYLCWMLFYLLWFFYLISYGHCIDDMSAVFIVISIYDFCIIN